ncbi:Sua5/YciO/YrdC/YwlC family protein [Lentzea sp. NBRC 102530]|uniref:Sua5/YciO/YrdC/YwlC family protein n=1 Tax=Lentzea sp. NBRC 102530 TaxID=3032201 RepID=UPI0024A3FBD0|nr:Sua5/YciO/YrdC/YwlC family protein [Lentzea sp. NBRC 102530]GLY53133.1 hypothetical protein Lesp01_67890 [Lentzea sp. NBRC 102530]
MDKPDLVRESALGGRLVLWEESARDGAQGKTLMSADFRVRLAREQGRMFGGDGPRHVVFAAGFPAVCQEEFDATRRVALEAAGSVSPAAVCRATTADVQQACEAVRGASNARVMIVVPASDEMADAMVHQPAQVALADAVSLVRQARALGVFADVCFADAPRADVDVLAAAATALTAAGAGVIVVADTTGDLLVQRCGELFRQLTERVGADVVLASHLHNDLGLGLANTLAAVGAGVRVVSSSWLGVAERSGMVATEQLLFLLAHRTAELVGETDLWHTAPDLALIPAIARQVSAEIGLPLTVTTPIVGTGVGTISTGTPFVRPKAFQPYDPAVLGIEPTVVLTHLASARVLRAVAERVGVTLDRAETTAALAWVKAEAFSRNEAVIPDEDFVRFVSGLRTAAGAVRAGDPVVLPNPFPLTSVIAATTAEVVNKAKGRPADQPVALWVAEDERWAEFAEAVDLDETTRRFARELLVRERLTLLLPLLPGRVPDWARQSTRDGHVLVFGACWAPLRPVLDGVWPLHVSSANLTGSRPAASPAEARAMFAPEVHVLDALAGAPVMGRAATTTLRVGRDRALAHARDGAQDRGHESPDAYITYLRATYSDVR